MIEAAEMKLDEQLSALRDEHLKKRERLAVTQSKDMETVLKRLKRSDLYGHFLEPVPHFVINIVHGSQTHSTTTTSWWWCKMRSIVERYVVLNKRKISRNKIVCVRFCKHIFYLLIAPVSKTCANTASGSAFDCARETNSIHASPGSVTCSSQTDGCTATECCTVAPVSKTALQVIVTLCPVVPSILSAINLFELATLPEGVHGSAVQEGTLFHSEFNSHTVVPEPVSMKLPFFNNRLLHMTGKIPRESKY